MSSIIEDHSSRLSVGDERGDVIKSGLSAKMNGLSEDSAGSACENDSGRSELKENGLANHAAKSSSHKHGDGHHHSSSKSSGSERDKHHSSSSAKHKDGVSSSSSKHSSSSSKHKENSSSKHRDGHSSSSSRHKEGSSSHHSSASSSSKHKEGSSSSSVHKEKDKSNSSSSKPKDGSESSSPDKHSSSSKHKESSSSSSSSLKHKESHSSSSSKPKDGASSKDKTSSSSASTDRLKDSSKDKSSSSSDKYKDRNKESGRSSDKDKSKSSSTSASSKNREGEKHSSSNVDKQKSQAKTEGSYQGENSVSSSMKNKVISQQPKVDVKVKIEAIEEDMEVSHTAATIKKEEPSSPVKNERYSGSPMKQPPIKSEDESEDDDKPLSVRKKESKPVKRRKEESDYEEDESQDNEEDEDSDVPLSMRNKAKKLKLSKKPEKKAATTKSTPPKKKMAVKHKKEAEEKEEDEPVKKKKKEENEESVWKWWEEQRENSDIKWTFLEHKGPVFAPLYEPLPKNVRFYYDGKPMHLTPDTEEVAVFYGRMLDHDYTTRDVFNTNFMKDWRKVMTAEEKAKITDLKKCNFQEICDYFKKKTEERKAMSKEEKQRLKKENEELVKEYGYCIIDKHKEKIGNFKIEPPGLFRGRGDHPKQGMLKHRINPEDVIINCSKDSKIPVPPAGRKWKEVRHDNTVTWLASWTENIQGATKYIMLNAASKLKGEKDWQKYETARKLHKCVDRIRAQYQEDWKSKEMRIRQRAVALYFIDKLALRAGNEKEEGETADTVGCCSLRVEHIKLHTETDEGKQYVVEFDFLGKDSIRYQNAIPVEKRVFKNLQLFMENKQPEDDLFDRLNTTILNKHLQDLMEGLTAKVFRTFNASKTLSEQLELLTNPNDTPAAKMLSYNRANRAVAILCNHQRAVPKTFEKSMGNLMKKIDAKRDEIKEVKKEIKDIKADYKRMKSVKTKTLYEKKKKTLARLEDQLSKLDVMATDKDENKEIALSTSKLNYLDPRISVAWCKKFGVPIEKVYNKTQRDKFRWAIDMADAHFKF